MAKRHGSESIFGFSSNSAGLGGRLKLNRGPSEQEAWTDALMPGDEATSLLDQSEASRRPLIIMGSILVTLLAILALRLFSLQVVGGQRNLGLADGNRIRQKVTRAPRGVIYDRNGLMLARNTANFDLTVVPGLLPRGVEARKQIYAKVSDTLHLDIGVVSAGAEEAIAGGPAKANLLQPILVAGNLDREKALLLDQGSLNVPGFSLDINPVREYLDGGTLAQFLGYTGRINPQELASGGDQYLPTDLIGKNGLEKEYESVLKGVNGSEQTEVDASGRPIKLLASKQPIAGNNISLTIDFELQKKLSTALAGQLQKSGSTKASAVAIDPRNGEVLAAVSLPNYDNNKFSRGISAADYALLTSDTAQPLFNKATSGAYPSGSIIKPLVASAVLEEHIVSPDTTIEDKGSLQVVNKYNKDITYTFFGWEHSGLGMMNVYRAIAMSSDIYFYTVAGGFGNFIGLGIDKLAAYYQKFGLGTRTGIDLPDETAGRVPTPEWKQRVLKESWFTGDTYNVSVGQGDILVSPLQMAVAISAIANGGTLYRPHFLGKVSGDDGTTTKTVLAEITRKLPISAANLAVVREGMRQTITSGTACCLIEQQVAVRVAGKTGTAETDTTGKRKPQAWFEAFAPYENPKIVIVALVENSGEGAEYAAPAVRETLNWYFSTPRP